MAIELTKRELPVYTLEVPVSVPGILDFITKIGLVVGIPERAHQISREFLSILARTPKADTDPNVYVEIDFAEPVTFGATAISPTQSRCLEATTYTEPNHQNGSVQTSTMWLRLTQM